jgi:histidyl-tRNA synthetase
MRLPAKISTFGGVWRYDEPQKGRYRFFHQWDIEIYGEPNIESDAEVIDFTSKFLTKLGLKNIVIDICDRELIELHVKSVFKSDSSDIVGDILRAVDKIQKKRKQDIVNEYREKGYSVSALEQILNFSEIKGTPEEIEKKVDVSKLKNWDKIVQLFDALKNRGVHNTRINFGIVRGLDYYSGIVFEVFENNDVGALVGGGRYDTLTKAFGRNDFGAVGAAGGVERIVLLMEKQKIDTQTKKERISVVFVNNDMKKIAINLASQLRLQGILTDVDLSGKSLKKQMEIASNSKYAIIIAPKEYADNSVILRNMADGHEKYIKIDIVLNDLKSSLQS